VNLWDSRKLDAEDREALKKIEHNTTEITAMAIHPLVTFSVVVDVEARVVLFVLFVSLGRTL
jgi:hypothetical protein